MDMITYEDFKKLDLRVAKILSAGRVEGSEKLIKLEVDLGSETRQLIAGIGKYYEPSELMGREIVVVANLEPKKFMGLESQGMLLAADVEGKPILLCPDKETPPGAIIK